MLHKVEEGNTGAYANTYYSLFGKNSMLLDNSPITWNHNFIPISERPARVTACQSPEG